MKLYRLRSCEALLGKFKELENQNIFLADSSSFNDPLEDFVWFTFKSDKILWEGMFKEFLVCLEYQVFTSIFYDENTYEEFYKQPVHGRHTGPYFASDNYKQRFPNIKKDFLNNEHIKSWICYLGERDKSIDSQQLTGILSIVVYFAMESISKTFEEENSLMKGLWTGLENILKLTIPQIEKLSTATLDDITKNKDKEDEILNTLFLDFNAKVIKNQFMLDLITPQINKTYKILEDQIEKFKDQIKEEELALITDVLKEMIDKNIQQVTLKKPCDKRIDISYFLYEFPRKFVEQLNDLVYYRWHAASFMDEFPERMDIWANYADSHTGVCLVFKDATKFKGSRFCSLEKVEYNDDMIEIDFFKNMDTISGNTFLYNWCINEAKEKSPIFEEVMKNFKQDDDYHKNFYQSISKIKSRKNTHWKNENEVRVLVDDEYSIHTANPDQSKLELSKYITWEIANLEAIIFGIRTSTVDKSKIYSIISKKAQNEQHAVEFYQAKFDKTQSKVVYEQLNF